MTVSRHPAILAGMQSMSTVEGRGAVPPGIYTPTFSMGVTFWPRRMPGLSLMTNPFCTCRRWKARMFSAASSSTARRPGSRSARALSICS